MRPVYVLFFLFSIYHPQISAQLTIREIDTAFTMEFTNPPFYIDLDGNGVDDFLYSTNVLTNNQTCTKTSPAFSALLHKSV